MRTVFKNIEEACQLREVLGLKALPFPQKQFELAQAHIQKLNKRRKEREAKANDPEEIERKKKAREQREDAKARKIQRDAEEGVKQFRAGTSLYDCKNIRDLPFELIRIVGDKVQTSRGAWVELAAAKTLYRALSTGRKVLGAEIGSYTVTGVEERQDGDKVIRIGCHRILLSEARSVLASQAQLALVQ